MILYDILLFFHLPKLKNIAVSIAPMTQEQSKDICIHLLSPKGRASLRVRKDIPYAMGTRTATVVIRDIHIGVIVSPAPLIIPDRL